jgi:hypothetical protein
LSNLTSLLKTKLGRPIPTVLTIAILTLPLFLSHGLFAVGASTGTTLQLVPDPSAVYVGQVNVQTLPSPSDENISPVALPNLSLSTQEQVGTDPLAIVTPGSQSVIHVVKDFAGTPGTNPNPCRCTPPDMGVAASTKFVVQMVNLAGTIWKNNGVLVTTFSLSDFWFLPVRGGPLGIGMSDPIVEYDAAADRFYASIIDTFDVNRVNFAVTVTNDPTGAWFIYRVIANSASPVSSNTLPDQPFIGYSTDKFLIASNDFVFDPTFSAASYIGSQFWVLNKAEMLSGCTAPTPCPQGRNIDAVTNNPSNTNFSIRPAQHLSPAPILAGDTTPTAYFAENCLPTAPPGVVSNTCTSSPTQGGINIYTVHGTPGTTASTSATVTTSPIAQAHFPRRADQPGNPGSLNAVNQARLVSAVWRNGLLWTAFNDGNSAAGCPQQDCARLDQISTTSFATLQDMDLTLPGTAVFYPALSTDSSNNLVVLYGSSSSTKFPDLEAVAQLSTMAPDTLSQAAVLVTSTAADISTRYGDYFWAATDPSTPNAFWVSGEFRQTSMFQAWSTQVAEVTL